MAFPIIAYLSMLHGSADLSPSGLSSTPAPDTGFLVDDLQDHRAFKIWKSSALTDDQDIIIDVGVGNTATCDYLSVINSNLLSQVASIQIFADSFTPPTTNRISDFTIDSDDVHVELFAAPSAFRYWKVRLKKGGAFTEAPFIGELLLGLRTTLPEFLGSDIDPFFKSVEIASSRSQGGNHLGAVIRGVKRRGEIILAGEAGISRSFYTSDLNAFLNDHAFKRLPFIFIVDSADADFDNPLWVRVTDTGEIMRTPVGGKWSRFRLVLPIEEAIMVSA